MSISDNILSKYSPKMVSFFVEQLSELEAKIAPLENELAPLLKERDDLSSLLRELGWARGKQLNVTAPLLFTPAPSEYNPSWSNLEKAVFLTKTSGFLTLTQIAELIVSYEKDRDIETIKNGLSVVFSQDAQKTSTNENRLIRRKNTINKKWEYMAK